jgi:hypothetical protein
MHSLMLAALLVGSIVALNALCQETDLAHLREQWHHVTMCNLRAAVLGTDERENACCGLVALCEQCADALLVPGVVVFV